MAALLKAALSLRTAPNMLPSFSWNTPDFNCSAPFMLCFSFAFVPLLHPFQFSASSRRSCGSHPSASCCLVLKVLLGLFALSFYKDFSVEAVKTDPCYLAEVTTLLVELCRPLNQKNVTCLTAQVAESSSLLCVSLGSGTFLLLFTTGIWDLACF